MFHGALQYLEAHDPRVLYLALGDTDEWAHAGRYDRYLDAVRRVGPLAARAVGDAGRRARAGPGQTSLLVTTDHGRGDGPQGWGQHGAEIAGRRERLGGAARARRRRRWANATTTSPSPWPRSPRPWRALAGEDFAAAHPKAARPLPLGPKPVRLRVVRGSGGQKSRG